MIKKIFKKVEIGDDVSQWWYITNKNDMVLIIDTNGEFGFSCFDRDEIEPHLFTLRDEAERVAATRPGTSINEWHWYQ